MDDVLLNKAALIEQSLQRIREVYAGDERNLYVDLTRQDSIVLNLQRASQAAIDLAMHLVRLHHLRVPQESRDAFTSLIEAGHLQPELGEQLKRMVGFRCVAVHDCERLNLDVVKRILDEHLNDFAEFAGAALRTRGFRESE